LSRKKRGERKTRQRRGAVEQSVKKEQANRGKKQKNHVLKNMSTKRARDTAEPSAPSGSAHDDDSYRSWKLNSPLLYDSLFNHNMVWPSLCVAWGDHIPTVPLTSQRRSSANASTSSSPPDEADEHSTLQALYFSSRTDARFNFDTKRWKGAPNFLLSASVDLPKPRHTNFRGVGRFQEAYKSTHINIMKRIVHPGEVNKIRLCPHSSDIIATHSDSELTYIWNMKTQPNRGTSGDLVASVPDLM
tara:strand:+ start:344 stop:1078 length:735 start_codon:yes stop_codon:yes gene_type:complete